MHLTDGLLPSIIVRLGEIRAANENEWPGPLDLIAKASLINTFNKEATPLSGPEGSFNIANNEKLFFFFFFAAIQFATCHHFQIK